MKLLLDVHLLGRDPSFYPPRKLELVHTGVCGVLVDHTARVG